MPSHRKTFCITFIFAVVSIAYVSFLLPFSTRQEYLHYSIQPRRDTKNDNSAIRISHGLAIPSSPLLISSSSSNSSSSLSLSSSSIISIICQLSGELGNNLGKYAYCHGVAQLLQKNHQLRSHILLRHQDHKKWKNAARDLHKCVPFFRNRNFSEANTPEVKSLLRRQQQQDDFFNDTALSGYLNRAFSPTSFAEHNSVVFTQALSIFVNHTKALWRSSHRDPSNNNSNDSSRATAAAAAAAAAVRKRLALPLLYISRHHAFDPLIDEYMTDLRSLFAWSDDDDACCKLEPDADETVFHLRNFLVEMRKSKELGFAELGPDQAAVNLFGHLPPGSKVAVLSRFPNAITTHEYVDALRRRGLLVRLITGQSGVQDFCFLRRTRKEMIGISISTFFVWAACLSNATRVVAYSVDSPGKRNRFGDDALGFNFSNPALAGRFEYPLFSLRDSNISKSL